MKRILFMEHSLPPHEGGTQRVTYLLSEYLNNNGFETFYAYWGNDLNTVSSERKLRYNIESPAKENIELIYQYVCNNKIDVLINQDRHEGFLYGLFKKLHGKVKIIHCLHLSPETANQVRKNDIGSKFRRFLQTIKYGMPYDIYCEREMYKLVDNYVLLSERFIEGMKKVYRIGDVSKIKAISNPLSFDVFFKESEIEQKKKQVCIVCRFQEKQKNVCSALRIWKRVEAFNKCDDWTLVIAGYGPDKNRILAYIDELHLQRVKFLGKVDDPIGLYKESSLFMMTSIYEGFGMTLTEASQQACIPIAFGSYESVYDIIHSGIDGFIVSAFDEKDYAEKMIELMINDKTRKKMAISAIINSQRFSITNIASMWSNLINS